MSLNNKNNKLQIMMKRTSQLTCKNSLKYLSSALNLQKNTKALRKCKK